MHIQKKQYKSSSICILTRKWIDEDRHAVIDELVRLYQRSNTLPLRSFVHFSGLLDACPQKKKRSPRCMALTQALNHMGTATPRSKPMVQSLSMQVLCPLLTHQEQMKNCLPSSHSPVPTPQVCSGLRPHPPSPVCLSLSATK